MSRRKLSLGSYLVGWICPLEIEQTAAMEMLDEEHEPLPTSARDSNVYYLGSINNHNVVIAGLPLASNNSAATVITQMKMTFPNLRYGLLVGIGGGVPVKTDEGPVRLGHVVVSKPTGQHSGAIQYDHGKAVAGYFERTGSLDSPPAVLLSAAQGLAVARARSETDPVWQNTQRIATHHRRLRRFAFPGAEKDHLYQPSYIHSMAGVDCEAAGCERYQLVSWGDEDKDGEGDAFVTVHRGNIASGEWVVKDALLRDQLAQNAGSGILCFEQEAVGVLTSFPCLVIRGISDYCDSHKNNLWQGFAAAAAAAYARQLFFHMPIEQPPTTTLVVLSTAETTAGEETSPSDADNELLDICLKKLSPRIIDDHFDQIKTFDKSTPISTHELYKAWSGAQDGGAESCALLALIGKPGTGKTALMKQAVLNEKGDPSAITIYHFLDQSINSSEASSHGHSQFSFLLRSLLGQLVDKVSRKPWEDIKSWAKELQSGSDAGLWSTERLQKIITKVILENGTGDASKPVRFLIFIDGINQCTKSMQQPDGPLSILLFCSELVESALSAGVDVRICLSREYVPQYGKREPKALSIEVDNWMTGAVDDYIQEQLKKVDDRYLASRLRFKFRERIGDGILWATVAVQGLLEMHEYATAEEMEEFVVKGTQDVNAVYERILEPVKPSDREMLQYFTIALGTFKPLTADQFRHASAFMDEFEYESIDIWEESDRGLKPGKMFENRLRHVSRGLMEVRTPGAWVEAEDLEEAARDDEVCFVNQAFGRFLREKHGAILPTNASMTLDQHCHLALFRVCIRVLDICRLRGTDTVKFLDYACTYWLPHAQRCQDVDLDVEEELPEFMRRCKTKKTSRVIEESIKMLRLSQAKESHLLEGQTSMLVLLSTMGCTSLLRRHLKTCAECDEACKSGDPRLYRAALLNSIIGRHPDTSSFLLECRSQGDINELFDNSTPLYDASYFASSGEASDRVQRMDLVRFLISRGADPAVHSRLGYEYPLHVAIALGNKLLIEELLKPSASRAEQLMRLQRKRKGWTALHFAVESGRSHRDRLSVLRTLLHLAPRGIGLLGLLDDDGNTPMALAEKMGGEEGEDFVEAFEDFEEEDSPIREVLDADKIAIRPVNIEVAEVTEVVGP